MKYFLLILSFLCCSNLIYSLNSDFLVEEEASIVKNEAPTSYSANVEGKQDDVLKDLSNAKTREDSLEIIKRALTVQGEASDEDFTQTKKLREEHSLQNAKVIYNNRFKQNLVSSPGVVKSSDQTLFNNFLQGVSFYNDVNGPSPYGEYASVWFNRNECDIETNYHGVVGMNYKRMPNEVVVLSRFQQLALRIPYPFPKHIFKVKGGVAIPRFSTNSEIEFMSVPLIKPCSNISDEQLFGKLKGQKFIGFTRNKNINISLGDNTIVNPFIYTVVEFHEEGFMSICYPALDQVFIPDGNFTVRGSIIVVGGENIAFVKNDGDAINLAAPYGDNVYKISNNFSTSTTSTKAGASTAPRRNSTKKTAPQKNTRRTTIQSKPTNNRRIKTDQLR